MNTDIVIVGAGPAGTALADTRKKRWHIFKTR